MMVSIADRALPGAGRILAFLLVLAMVALMTGLGFWQLERAGEKRAVLETQARRAAQPLRAFDWGLQDYRDRRYQRVFVRGDWLRGRDFLIDNRMRDGRPGFQVVTPWRSAASRDLLLVDRGWVPAPALRDRLPDYPPAGRERRLEGYLFVPWGGGLLLGELFENDAWPRIAQRIDFEAFSRALGQPVLPVVLRLERPASGLVQEWPVVNVRPERHLAYAIQWFVMAAVLALLGTLLLMRGGRREHERDDT